MNHVVNSTAVGLALMSGGSTQVDELLVTGHLRARLARADAKELNDQEVKFEDELANVFIHPDALVDLRRQFADFLYASGLVPDQLLQVLLHIERAFHA